MIVLSPVLFVAEPQETLSNDSLKKQADFDAYLLDLYTTLSLVKNMHKKIDAYEQQDDFLENIPTHTPDTHDEENQQSMIMAIMVILSDTYQKIIKATVAYYVMSNTTIHYDLHTVVAKILAEDSIKIFGILGQGFTRFMLSHTMTWKEKIWYCVSIMVIIVGIKLAIDGLPQKYTYYDFYKNDNKNSYVEDKFCDYA